MNANKIDVWRLGLELLVTWWLQASVLLVIGLIATVVFRRPAHRSVVLRTTLVAVLLCPIFSQLSSSCELTLLSLNWYKSNDAVLEMVAADRKGELADSSEPTDIRIATNPEYKVAAHRADASLSGPSDSPTAESVSSLSSATAIPNQPNSRFSLSTYFVAIWMIVASVLLIRLSWQLWNNHRLLMQSVLADPACELACREAAKRLNVKATPKVLVNPFLSSPCLIGHFRPSIVLPEELDSRTYVQVFVHELAHLQRSDWLWCVIGRTATALLWFQPLIWWLHRQSLSVAEDICDDVVILQGCSRATYLTQLVEIADRSIPQAYSLGLPMVGFRSKLGKRAIRILDTKRILSTKAGRGFAVMVMSSMLLVTSSLGLVSIGHAQTTTTSEFPVNSARSDAPIAIEDESTSQEPVATNSTQSNERPVLKISGRAIDESGMPVPNAVASLEGVSTKRLVISKACDEAGRFQIELPVETQDAITYLDLYLWVSAPNFNLKCVRPQNEAGKLLPCEVILRKSDQIGIKVLEAGGKPCSRATIEPHHYDVPNGVYYSDRSTGLISFVPDDVAETYRTTTDADGIAEINGLSLNNLKSVLCATDEIIPQVFGVSKNGPNIIRLSPTGKLVGRVVCNEAGSERPDWKNYTLSVSSTAKKVNAVLNDPFRDIEEVSCFKQIALDDDGTFELDGLLSGNLSIHLITEGPSNLRSKRISVQELAAGETLSIEIELAKAIRVQGRILTEDTRQPVAFTRVSIQGTNVGEQVLADEAGNYEVMLLPGTYHVQAFDLRRSKLTDYSYPKTATIVVTSNSTTIPEMLCPPRQPLERGVGLLLDKQGRPMADRMVALISQGSRIPLMTGTSDGNGKVDLRIYKQDQSTSRQEQFWVLFPIDYKSIEGDVRDYPNLEIQSDSPLTLVADE